MLQSFMTTKVFRFHISRDIDSSSQKEQALGTSSAGRVYENVQHLHLRQVGIVQVGFNIDVHINIRISILIPTLGYTVLKINKICCQ